MPAKRLKIGSVIRPPVGEQAGKDEETALLPPQPRRKMGDDDVAVLGLLATFQGRLMEESQIRGNTLWA